MKVNQIRKNSLYIFSHYVSSVHDLILGIDFDSKRQSTISHINGYESTTWLAYINLRKFLRNKAKGNSIIDIGCGKGKMIYFFSKFPFKKIGGLEYFEELANTAVHNLTILKEKKKINLDRIEIINGDASIYTDYSDYNFFYLYNSFDDTILRKFLDILIKNVQLNHRKIWVIYVNPVHENIFKEKGFKLEGSFYFRTRIYTYGKYK